jgi:glycine/D-amino acid oxidase-like deaminating enzyme
VSSSSWRGDLTSFLPADAQGVVFRTPLLDRRAHRRDGARRCGGSPDPAARRAPRRDRPPDDAGQPRDRRRLTARLPPTPGRRAFAALSDGALDVVVIGGGIVGCGALLDATSRGLRAGARRAG